MRAKSETTIRAALYARYSSDVMNDQSIERQFADLEKVAAKFGFSLNPRHYFSDRAQSAATLFDRPGLTRDLLGAAKRREFDVLLVEQTDRLARNKGDAFMLDDNLKFNYVRVFTPAGEVSELQLMFESFANADYLKKLALRVKSGHDKIARNGLIPSRAAYGYDCVTHHLPGEVAGRRVINKAQAAIVVRIFTEYVSGVSPRQIAIGLTRDNVPAPNGGKTWNFQSIVGGAGSKRGIIRNRLYIGEYLKNRFYNVKNPENGKIIKRRAETDDLITVQVPHLRIVSQELWDAADKLRTARGNKKIGAGRVERATIPRKQHLLTGLLRCDECNGPMTITASSRIGQRVACSAAYNTGSCKHSKSYNLAKLTELAVESMCTHLVDPDFIKRKTRDKAIEFARLEKENSGARQAAVKQFNRLDVQIKKLVRVLEEEDDMPKELLALLKAKEIERKGLEERIRLLAAESNVTTLHPNVIQAFGKNIETLHAKLKRNPADPECRMAFGNIIDSIIVHPTGYRQPYEISLYARLSAIMGIDLFPKHRTNKEILAAEGLPRIGTGGPASLSGPD